MIRELLVCTALLLGLAIAQETDTAYFTGVATYQIQFKGRKADVEFLKANQPNDELTMMIGEGDYIVQLDGGKYPKTFMFIADSNYEYSIDIENKRAFRHSAFADLNRDTSDTEPVAEPTGRTKQVGDYLCQEYVLKKDDAVFYYYVTDDFRVDLGDFPADPNSKAMFLAKGLDGRLPLRTVRRTQQLAVETTLTEIERRTFYDEAFTIPKGFVVKGRDVRY